MAEVELIASGYAWRCPECNHTEYENEVPAARSVRCGRCGAYFRMARVLHRVEAGALEGLGDNGDSRADLSGLGNFARAAPHSACNNVSSPNMLITLRIPKTGADRVKLGSASSEIELTVTLTAVELAGRLTIAAGKPISPEAVMRYRSALQAAMAASTSLANKHGPARLTEMLREGCRNRSLWVPDRDEDVLFWLQCVLLVHFLSSRTPDTLPPEEILNFASLQTAARLAELCEMNFPGAYHLWVLGEATDSHVGEPRPAASPLA